MSEPLLRIADLEVGYGTVPVLFKLGLEVRAGEIVTLVGSNGAGKTTLLRAVSRVIPSRGTLRFEGTDISLLTPEHVFSRGLVQVPEGRQLFGKMTVEENLLMGAKKTGPRYDAVSSAFMSSSLSLRTVGASSPATCRAASSRCAPWRVR